MRKNRVQALLMGGQACVFYGAAEFSRDADFAILADTGNLKRLQAALDDLQAQNIAVPPLELKYLKRGHGVHFRCAHPEAMNIRIDIMARMRGVSPFPTLWKRRTTIELPDGTPCDLLSLPDLVRAKKTQRDRDWPMIRRLIESHYFEHRNEPSAPRVRFWLRELRTPGLLVETAGRHPDRCRSLMSKRPLLQEALTGNVEAVEMRLREEEAAERKADRTYWKPLRIELEKLRHGATTEPDPPSA